MAVVFASQAYYRAVRDDLAVLDPLVKCYFGWSKVPRQNTGVDPVIIWVPGDPSGVMGEDVPAISIGDNPRAIANTDEFFTVRMRAHDPGSPTDDEAQYAIVRVLYDEWRASMYRAGYGIIKIKGLEWNIARKEGRLGAELVVGVSFKAPVPDFDTLGTAVSVTAIINAGLGKIPDAATSDFDADAVNDGDENSENDFQGTTKTIPVDPNEDV